MTLTVAACKALQPGQSIKDDVVPGLVLRRQGKLSVWSLRYRTKTLRQRWHRIGQFPGFSIEGARKVARAVLTLVASGQDPAKDIAERRHLPTVNDLCDLYIDRYLGKKPSGQKDWLDRPAYIDNGKPKQKEDPERLDLGMIHRYVRPGLGKLAVADVQQSDVETFLDRVLNQDFPGCRRKDQHPFAPVMMNRVRALLSTMFNLAMTQPYGYMRGKNDNPVGPTTKNPEHRRKRIATPAEMKAIAVEMDKLRETYPRHIAALWTIWMTGARKNEIAKAEVGDRQSRLGVFEGDRLVLAKHKTAWQTGEKTIHLPAQASAILDATLTDSSGRLFGKTSVDYVWRLIRKAVGCTDLTIHDIRRTFISIGVFSGDHTLKQMGSVVGHSSIETTNGYAWMLDQQQRAVAQNVADRVESFMRPAALPAPRRAVAFRYRRRAPRASTRGLPAPCSE